MQRVLKPCSDDPRNTCTNAKSHFFEKSLSRHPETKLIVLHGGMKCAHPLNYFSCTKFNHHNQRDFYELRWIGNSAFWLWVENYKIADNVTKYKIQSIKTGTKMVFISHVYHFQWTHPLKSKPIIWRSFNCLERFGF